MAVSGHEDEDRADRQSGRPGQAPWDGVGATDHTAEQNVGKRSYHRKRQGWDIHYGYILHLIGMSDAEIAGALGITEAAVTKRRKLKWAFGRA